LTAAAWRSAFVAALFALHPLNVESVAWISERKNVLSAFFGLAAILMYARYVEKFQSFKSKVYCGMALLAFAFSLMSKQMLVTLPFVFLLLDYWPLNRWRMDLFHGGRAQLPRLVLEKTFFFLLGALACVVSFLAEQKGGSVQSTALFPIGGRIENAFVAYSRYLGKTFWPENLAVFYPYPKHWPLWLVLFAVALFIGLCFIVVRLGRRFPFMPVGWFWFVGTLVPVIGLVQEGQQSLADRHAYIPLIGVFIILAWSAGEVCMNRRVFQPLVIFLAAAILALCAWQTRGQLNFWRNSGTLFRHALAVTENNFVAWTDFGTYLSSQGRVTEAMDCFQKSLEINPGNADTLYNFGNALTRLGKVDEAITNYRRALEIDPNQADTLANLGFALAAKKQFGEAVSCFEKSLQLDPDSADAHNNLATVLFIEHRFAEAAQHFREAIRLAPDNAQIYANLGDALVKQGQLAEAVQNYQTALRLNPGDARTKAKLQALGAPISN
jgi:tetratricopeptide (TPR) repeat protein